MNKKNCVLIMLLFLIINLFMGCAKIHIYTSNDIKTFEKDIKLEYPNIDKVQVRRVGIVIYITYVLTNHETDEEIEKLFKTTEEYISKDNFARAVTKEDKAERNSLGRATMRVINPDADKKKGTHEINYGLSVKGR